MYNKYYKFFSDIAYRIWVHWSNFRYRKCIRYVTTTRECEKVYSEEDIRKAVKIWYNNFQYTKDGIKELGDAIIPPSEAYYKYTQGLFKDDCDGFHSLVYHCLNASKLSCYLLCAKINSKYGHCVLVFNFNNRWYVCDYDSIYGYYNSLNQAVYRYNEIYSENCGLDTNEVKYNCFLKYDYEKGKFKFVNAYELLSK